MSTILDIQRKPKFRGLFTVSLDNGQTFDISDLELSLAGLKIGLSVTSEQASQYQADGDQNRAYDEACRYLLVRPHSRFEVVTYLRRRQWDGALIERVAERLVASQLIDDRQFVETWVANRQLNKPRSQRHLVGELLAKGVPREVIDDVLRVRDPDDETRALHALAQKKSKLSQYQQPQKLAQYLVRQGYEYSLVKKVLDQLESDIAE